jgi:formamidopyrimidine-DNA glycosylase
MPEVAEVKIIADSIRTLLGETLTEVTVLNPAFQKRTKNLELITLPAPVAGVHTRGKFCYILLADGSAIGLGFGMDGNIRIHPPDEAYLQARQTTRERYMRHCHVRFNGNFYYDSARRFGHVTYYSPEELREHLQGLGPCILSMPAITPGELVGRWRRKNASNICQVLLNCQDLVAGIGNYIKSEILYSCRVDPMATVSALSDETLYALYLAAREVAAAAYNAGGASLYTYTGLHGERTPFKYELAVYDQQMDPLGNVVQRMETPDGRTTHWVPSMQRKRIPVKVVRIVPLTPRTNDTKDQ